jgi:hypothetical protein
MIEIMSCSRRFCIITKAKHLPSTPFLLVELSSRTKTTEENMAFFKPDVVFCPKASDLVLHGVQGWKLMGFMNCFDEIEYFGVLTPNSYSTTY